ncbi:MAG TPA: hypothetical protein VFV10_00805 [Gammaproteobacteria bacterium]|nr:hypothetical protein [Gammaproteobacteria bacterium]
MNIDRRDCSAKGIRFSITRGWREVRARVHELYERLGFQKHGVEFRIDFA